MQYPFSTSPAIDSVDVVPAIPAGFAGFGWRRRFSVAALALTMFILLTPAREANAQTKDAAEPPSVDLQASASNQIANDEMVVRLSAQQSGTDMGAMNEKVLSSLQAAIEKSKQVAGVSARLGSITTQPQWGPQGKRSGWQVQGSLVLEGCDHGLSDFEQYMDQVLAFVGVNPGARAG